VRPSPIVALNRAIAIAQDQGAERGLEEIRLISNGERLAGYPFYAAALGELEFRRGSYEAAHKHFRLARDLARNTMERQFFDRRLGACERGDPEQAFCELFWDRMLDSLQTRLQLARGSDDAKRGRNGGDSPIPGGGPNPGSSVAIGQVVRLR